ncbi:MAG TPA: hypothetical protein VHX15_14530 [Frankiaceae bacterium]|jgi:hypothetical protein|nr:hypothetical protein [Frankiaceae bacterium]
MVSDAHEELVARIEAQGMRTPETFPGPDEFALARTLESSTPVPPIEGVRVTAVDAGGVPAIWVDPPAVDTDRALR